MVVSVVPEDIQKAYELHEWRHAWAVLATDFPEEFNELIKVLREFKLKSSYIIVGGGNKGPIAKDLDQKLGSLGWKVKNFDTQLVLDKVPIDSPTHEIDCFKNKVALEIEWNNKDPFFDRDLNNFRLLFDLRAISVGIIITRSTHLHEETFRSLPPTVHRKYGASTTHMGKLLPKLNGGGGGGCPIIAIGIGKGNWHEDITPAQAPEVLKRIAIIKKFIKTPSNKDKVIPRSIRYFDGLDLATLLGKNSDSDEEDDE